MANTYTQIHIHFVFAVKYRRQLIRSEWKNSLYKYITTVIQNDGHKVLNINGMPDHIHIFIGMRPHQAVSALVQKIKTVSSKWIRQEGFCNAFAWQEGFGAFTYSQSQVSSVIRYIQNQEKHHCKQSFLDEYRHVLKVFEVEYDEKYMFAEPQ